MKQLLPVFLLCFLFAGLVQAQNTVSVSTESVVITGKPTDIDLKYYVDVINTSSNAIGVHWSRNNTNAPAGWANWICDKNLCYTLFANNSAPSMPNMLNPGEKMEFQIHLTPGQIEGTGEYIYTLTDLDDPSNILGTIVVQVIISNTVSTKNPAAGANLTVFPNPTTDYFQVSDVTGLKYVEIYNIVGNKMKSYDAVPNKQYFIGDLNEGIYLVRMIASSGKVLKTVRVSKR